MATVTRKRSAQSLDARFIALTTGEVATVKFASPETSWRASNVNWSDGLSWSIKPQAEGSGFSVRVDYSLFLDGDDDWTAHFESPLTEEKQEAEFSRIDRIRFTVDSGSVYISIGSPALFTVETA